MSTHRKGKKKRGGVQKYAFNNLIYYESFIYKICTFIVENCTHIFINERSYCKHEKEFKCNYFHCIITITILLL